ncbi:MAG: hypothetical protein WD335_01775 [Candidatus Paceibacterota bacterium]
MFQIPLHHCYLIQAASIEDCAAVVMRQLQDIHADVAVPTTFDIDTVDIFTIEMAREVRQRGQQKAGGEAFCIVRGFDSITTEAQNALLKIIESPASGVHLFFLTPQPGELLETIQSRTLRLDGICDDADQEITQRLVDEFTAGINFQDRLEVVEKITTRRQLRVFAKIISTTKLPRENPDFGKALELVVDWGRDSGSSVKLLGQYLATTAGRSHERE